MRADKRNRLEKAGWKVGSAREFLELTDAEAAVIDIRISLARELKRYRLRQNYSQAMAARIVGSSQSRVARMEAGDPSVSLDLLVRALLALGSTTSEVGRVIARAASHRSGLFNKRLRLASAAK